MQVKAEPKANSNWKEFKFWIFFLLSWNRDFCFLFCATLSHLSALVTLHISSVLLPFSSSHVKVSVLCVPFANLFLHLQNIFCWSVFCLCISLLKCGFYFFGLFWLWSDNKKGTQFFFFFEDGCCEQSSFWVVTRPSLMYHCWKRRHFEATLASSACCNCFYPEVKWTLSADWTEVTLSCARLHLAAVCSYCDATATKWNWYISLYITYLIFNMRTLEYKVGFFTTQILW